MTTLFGDRATFAVEVGEFWHAPALRVVDLWAGGKRLTVDDNTAYLPSFRLMMRRTADQVAQGLIPPRPFPDRTPEETFHLLHADETGFREPFWFLHWGETVDNVSGYAYLDREIVFTFEFWRPTHPVPDDLGQVFTARIPPDEFVATVRAAADFLERESS